MRYDITERQKIIHEILQKSIINDFNEDYEIRQTLQYSQPIIKKGMCFIRFFQMTKDEYKENKLYTFTILFGCLPSHETICEGMCYDVRTLLKENYINIYEKIYSVPIPLSSKRWNWLIDHIPKLELYSRQTGILEYPLSYEDIDYIFLNISKQPSLCSHNEKGCLPIILDKQELQEKKHCVLKYFFDNSKEDRFGPKKIDYIIPNYLIESKETVTMNEDDSNNNDKLLLERIETLLKYELKDINIYTTKIQQYIESFFSRNYILQLIKNTNANEQQIVSIIIENVLFAFLSQKL